MMEKKRSVGVSILGIVLFIVINLLYNNVSADSEISDTTVKVIKIDQRTEVEETIFIFNPQDFKEIFVIKHAFIQPYNYETRGLFIKTKHTDWINFCKENIGNRINVMINDERLFEQPPILREVIDYVPFGYTSKEEAFERAKKLTTKIKYEDWEKKEIRENEKRKREYLRRKK